VYRSIGNTSWEKIGGMWGIPFSVSFDQMTFTNIPATSTIYEAVATLGDLERLPVSPFGMVFETDTEMNDWLSNTENAEKLPVGFSFYVRGAEWAKYWWDGEAVIAPVSQ